MSQLFSQTPWHSKLESTVRYLGTEVDDGLEISEPTEIREIGGSASLSTVSGRLIC